MSSNPWTELPLGPPFVLPSDEALVKKANARWGASHRFFVHDAFLPEPFQGSTTAPVICLSNNGGIGAGADIRNDAIYREKWRRNLLHEPLDYPLVFLDPELAEYGRRWWEQKTKPLIAEFGRKVVARSILNVLYYPYISQNFDPSHLRLPSQDYSFGLVRDAVNRNALIVLMRTGQEKLWKEAVPELNGYNHFLRVSNPQNPAISPGNLGRDFQRVVEAIEEHRRRCG
ncbi:MAG: hypothetical protein EXR98_07160 [Gemmataceae bacterium]|nr:hypothetical protein [Gemmataceae bacterium]